MDFLFTMLYTVQKAFIELLNFLISFIAYYLFWGKVISELISGKLSLK